MDDRTEIEKKIEEYTLIIDGNNETSDIIDAYSNRGLLYYKLKEYQKAIKDFNYLIINSDNKTRGYVFRCVVYNALEEYQKVIEDSTKVINVNKYDHNAYYIRGFAHFKLYLFEKAIEDLNKVLEYKPEEKIYYSLRGYCYLLLEKFDKAIDDYNEWIIDNNNDSKGHYYRGIAFFKNNQPDKAIEDFNDCIRLNYMLIETYSQLGHIYYIQEKYKESANSFNLAKKDTLFVLSELYKIERKESIIKIKTVISEMIDLDGTNFFNRTTSSLNHTEQQACKDIYIIMLELISILHINNKIEITFSHYTKRSTASQLIFKPSPFRLNSTITCNDPEEGKTLLKYLGKDEIDNPKKEHNYQAFIGCFTFNRESLNQFRLYGKEDNKEATGVSLEIKKEFFDEEVGVSILDQICQPDTSQLLESESNFVEKTDKEENNKKDKEEKKKYALYRCIYIDPEIKRAISVGHIEEYAFYKEKGNCSEETIKEYKKYKEDIAKVIEHVNLKLEELCEDIEIAKGEKNENLPIICELLLPLRYLVKHVAFKEEQECRIFDVKDLKEDKIKNKEIHFTDDFMQMYIEYQPITKEELAGVVFAPKAENIDVFNEALRQKDFEIQCERSTLPFA